MKRENPVSIMPLVDSPELALQDGQPRFEEREPGIEVARWLLV